MSLDAGIIATGITSTLVATGALVSQICMDKTGEKISQAKKGHVLVFQQALQKDITPEERIVRDDLYNTAIQVNNKTKLYGYLDMTGNVIDVIGGIGSTAIGLIGTAKTSSKIIDRISYGTGFLSVGIELGTMGAHLWKYPSKQQKLRALKGSKTKPKRTATLSLKIPKRLQNSIKHGQIFLLLN